MAPPAFVRAVSYGVYEGSMRGVIHALKYDRMVPVARELGSRLADAIAQLATDSPEQMLVVPVPLHRSRMAQRGFNQARTLVAEALRILRKSRPEWRLELSSSSLVRQRQTNSGVALALIRATLERGDPTLVNRDLDRYLAVTADDVLRVARTYLRPENRTVIEYLPA